MTTGADSMRPSATPRYCARCGARLASDNAGTACSPCQRTAREAEEQPPQVPSEFWDNPQLRDALIRDRHIGRAVRSYREHPFHGQKPISQSLAAKWLNISQTQLSRIEGGRPLNDLDRLIQWSWRKKLTSTRQSRGAPGLKRPGGRKDT
jgi:hypothetical protein